jgi:S-DNA-T family DNA segregation ATPase FtsK/SpoIIIE
MLFKPMDENTPMRIQGAWITDEEIKRVVDYTVSQQKAEYDEKLMNLSAVTNNEERNEMRNNNMEEEEYDDPLYNDIVEFIVKTGKASASLLQRRFKLGYNRAARIIDLLEERGIIGPQNGSKPREVLVELENNNSNYDDEEDYNE